MKIKDIKSNNKNSILRYLYKEKKASKKELSERLNMSQSLLTKLSSELLQEKKILSLEKKEEVSRRGPKEVFLGINENYGYVMGIIINHIRITVILSDISFNIKEKISFSTLKNCDESLIKIKNSIDKILSNNNLLDEEILGFGITLKGLTDGQSSLYGIWDNPVNIYEFFSKHYNNKIIIENGVRANAVFEKIVYGLNDFLFIKYFEAGIGGALIENNKLVYGDNNLMLDFGHIVIDPSLEKCPLCKKNGCLESIISVEKILEKASKRLRRDVDFQEVLKLIDDANPLIVDLILEVAKLFSIALINTLSLIDIRNVRLSGNIFSSSLFRKYVKEYLNTFENFEKYRSIEFITEEYNYIPAVALIIDNIIFYE